MNRNRKYKFITYTLDIHILYNPQTIGDCN